jgi:UDP-N-acetylglucosamine 4-epimerase
MKVLITGGAGFIGSNLVRSFLSDDSFDLVRVLDNLSTGNIENIHPFLDHPKFEFIEGDIRDFDACMKACEEIDRITHQAAIGSVPRSIKDPITSNEVNITGTLNIFTAAKESGVDRVIYAASSSTYGDSENLPKVEHIIGKPLSPYAVTKYVMELYASTFNNLYNVDFVGMRYFNVFGYNQSPSGAYAAVIPLFFQAAMNNEAPTINGDGTNSRDFTFVDNVVEANRLALITENKEALNQIYNVACGDRTNLNELWDTIKKVSGSTIDAIHGPNRTGDIPHSLADISKIKDKLGYAVQVRIHEGLALAYRDFIRLHLASEKS